MRPIDGGAESVDIEIQTIPDQPEHKRISDYVEIINGEITDRCRQ